MKKLLFALMAILSLSCAGQTHIRNLSMVTDSPHVDDRFWVSRSTNTGNVSYQVSWGMLESHLTRSASFDTITINGVTYHFPDTTGPSGSVLTDTSGTGFLAWRTPTAASAYKVYTILLSGSGSGISVNQLQNTIGDGSGNGSTDIAWSNPSNGTLFASMTTGTPFTTGKVYIAPAVANVGNVPYFITGAAATQNLIVLKIFKYDGTSTGTPSLFNTPIEIRVYN